MLFKRHTVLPRFVGPPRRNHVQREPSITDPIDVGRLFRQQRGQMERRSHRHHQFDPFGYRGQRRCCGPGVQRRRLDALNIIEVELGNQRKIKANLFAPLRKLLHVLPVRLHVFVFDVAQPAAENGKPVAVSHRGPPLAATCSFRFDS